MDRELERLNWMIRLSIVVKGSYSARMLITSGILQDFIYYLEQAIECTLVKFTEDIKALAPKCLK